MPDAGLVQNAIPLFLEAFKLHLKRLNAQSDEVRRFIYHYLPTGVLNQIAAAAVDKMAVTLADGKEHSSALIKPPVVYDILTIPTELERAAVWFAGEHGSYSEFLSDMWQTFEKVTRTSSIFCHVMYGWGKDGGWVHLGVWPMEKNPHSEALIVPIECLTDEEKRTFFDDTPGANNAPADSGSNEDNVLATADLLTYFASREQVKAGDIHDALEFLVRLLQPGNAQRFKGRLLFGISGYDEDPRELYQIPEVREWMRDLDDAFTYWFYFLVRDPRTMNFVTFALCEYVDTPLGGQIKPAVLADFMTAHYAAMNELCDKLGESEEEIKRLSDEIAELFYERAS